MREILFRGKRTDNGKWVEGGFFEWLKQPYIVADITDSYAKTNYEVIPETVGQFTGLTDKNGKKIFEGDIIKHFNHSDNPEKHAVYKVEFNEVTCMFVGRLHKNWAAQLRTYLEKNYEVIGNIYDNPELLKGGAEND